MDDIDKKTLDLRTICRDCIFALYDEQYTEQEGCIFGRTEKYKAQNKLKQIEDEETELKYYEISTVCNLCRNGDWASNFEDPTAKALEQIKVKVGFVVLGGDNDGLLWYTLDSILRQTVLPDKIVVVFYARTKSSIDIINYLTKHAQPKGVEFELVNVFKTDKIEYLIDVGVSKLNSQYYTIYKSYRDLSPYFIEKLNKAINEDMRQVSMILPTEGVHGLTIQKKLHEIIGGNNNISVIEKVKELAKNQNLERMIIEHSEL